MNAVKKFNGLNGTVATRQELGKLIELAKKQEQTEVVERLEGVLSKYDHEKFLIDLQCHAVECIPASILPFIDEAPELPEEEHGLGKAVSPDDIYTMITNKMIEFIKQANKADYKKAWEGQVYGTGYLIPFNFESKKRYRGINFYMLRDFDKPLENPFYLTFKQVDKLGGKVKKGSFGHEVVYFTRLYRYSQTEPALDFDTYDQKKFDKWFQENKHLIPAKEHDKDHALPILKYYKVFNGKDIEGIDFDLENFKTGYINKPLPPNEPMPVADAIVENFPSPKVPIKHGGDKAAYYPGFDHIKMPYKADFDTAQDYYRTLFHELGHATGHKKRLERDLTGRFGSKKYAFEELIAELNAVFVSAEAGLMWHTNKNHAAYLKGWNSALTHIKEDNRFVMRAATQAQKATDFILQPDKEGNPAYLKTLKVETRPAKSVPKKPKSVSKPKTKAELEAANPKGFAKKPKSIAVTTAIKDILSLPKYKGKINERQAAILYKHFKDKPISDDETDIVSEYEQGILGKNSSLHEYYDNSQTVDLTDFGVDFIKAVAARHESLLNQKHNLALFDGLKGPQKNKALSECEKLLPDFDITKKKGKAAPGKGKKEFIVNIPIESISYKFNTEKPDQAKVKELIKAGTKNIAPLQVWQDKKSGKIYLIKGRNELEAFIKLNEENVPVIFSKTPPKSGLNGYTQTEVLNVKDEFSNLNQSEINKLLVSVYEKLNNKKATNLETGRNIIINKVGKGKQLYSRVKFDSKTATAIKNLLHLLEYAKLINEAKPKAHHIKKYKATKILNFEAKIIIDGRAYYFILTVLENEKGHLKYFVQPSEIKKSIRARSNKAKKQSALPNGQRKYTKKSNTTKKGLKSPAPTEPTITLQPEPQQPAQHNDRGDRVVPEAPVRKNKLMDMEFDALNMDEGWGNFMQHPAANMKIAIWGKPKNGKTSGALQLANYLTKHGNVLYNFADQGFNKSTQDLWKTSGLANKPNATPSDIDNLNELEAEIKTGNYNFVFIDMINDYINRDGITPQDFKDRFIKQYPNTSFILVFETTKRGDFKGDQAWTHIVDAIVTVENFLMENRGRYGTGHFVVWKEGLKKFDPKRYEEIQEETQPEPENPQPVEVEAEEIPGFSIIEV